MKRLVLTIICVASSFMYPKITVQKFQRAIEEAREERISVLLKKMERQGLTLEKKREFLADLHDTTADHIDLLEEQMGTFRNVADAAKTILGGTLMMTGALVVSLLPRKFRTYGIGLGALGFVPFYFGMRCSSQNAWVEKVRVVQTMFGQRYDQLQKELLDKNDDMQDNERK